jgi:Effector Associated Constant Component 1
MNMPTILSLTAEVTDTRLMQITRSISRDLSRAGVPTKLIEAPSGPGERGDTFSLGQLALGLVTSGAVTALIECLQAYIARDRTLIAKITKPDGAHIEVTAQNVGTAVMQQALEAAFKKINEAKNDP